MPWDPIGDLEHWIHGILHPSELDPSAPVMTATPTHNAPAPQPHPAAVQNAGAASVNRIAGHDDKGGAHAAPHAAPHAHATPYTATVHTHGHSLRLRKAPSTEAEILARMPPGAHVTVTGAAQNGFLPVKYSEGHGHPLTGFASAEWLRGPSSPQHNS